ncbi:hypothetical protein [Sphingomonas dokdonensis]|nr:hypothetical protein [Sphingomonas dokdonensis]
MALAQSEGVDVPALIESYERGLVALKEAEPKGLGASGKPGKLSSGLADDLALLCTKIAPTIAVEQADAWNKVMVTALSDLPGRVAREAAQAALHTPMRFLNEVEGVIREKAVPIGYRHSMALRRLRELEAAIRRALEPDQPALAAPNPEPELTVEQIRALTPELRSIGVKIGAITQDQVAHAIRSNYVPHEEAA